MKKGLISSIANKVNPVNKQFVSKNLDITEQVMYLLKEKGLNQKDLARKLDKSESEISKLLSGLHNLTLKSIAKLEVEIGEDIITTPLKAVEKYKTIEYISLKIDKTPSHNNYDTGVFTINEHTGIGEKVA